MRKLAISLALVVLSITGVFSQVYYTELNTQIYSAKEGFIMRPLEGQFIILNPDYNNKPFIYIVTENRTRYHIFKKHFLEESYICVPHGEEFRVRIDIESCFLFIVHPTSGEVYKSYSTNRLRRIPKKVARQYINTRKI